MNEPITGVDLLRAAIDKMTRPELEAFVMRNARQIGRSESTAYALWRLAAEKETTPLKGKD